MKDEKRETNEQHVTRLKMQLEDIIAQLKNDIPRVDDPRVKVLFELSAEVLGGVRKAFTDYQEQKEEAWR